VDVHKGEGSGSCGQREGVKIRFFVDVINGCPFPLNLVVFFNILGFNISDASMLGVGLTHNLPKQAHDLYVNY